MARQTDGDSRFVTPRERVDQAAFELFSTVSSPVAKRLAVNLDGASGKISPTPATTVYAGTPVTVFGEVFGDAVAFDCAWQGAGGAGKLHIDAAQMMVSSDETVRLMRGARLISDLEAEDAADADARTRKRITEKLGSLGREYGLASRAMSLVAVVHAIEDRSGKLARSRVVPVGMPADMRMDAYFDQTVAGMDAEEESVRVMMSFMLKPNICNEECSVPMPSNPRSKRRISHGPPLMRKMESCNRAGTTVSNTASDYTRNLPAPAADDDWVASAFLRVAAMIEPDGGLGGGTRMTGSSHRCWHCCCSAHTTTRRITVSTSAIPSV